MGTQTRERISERARIHKRTNASGTKVSGLKVAHDCAETHVWRGNCAAVGTLGAALRAQRVARMPTPLAVSKHRYSVYTNSNTSRVSSQQSCSHSETLKYAGTRALATCCWYPLQQQHVERLPCLAPPTPWFSCSGSSLHTGCLLAEYRSDVQRVTAQLPAECTCRVECGRLSAQVT